MPGASPNPWLCALSIALAFIVAGALQATWLYSKTARRFGKPLDGGRTIRGQRIFGDNKTWRGFVVMIPATGLAFLLMAWILRQLHGTGVSGAVDGLWQIEWWQYGLLGCWAGFGFMLAELPNSFLKRQLKVNPGETPQQPWARTICFVLDQIDSVVGALLAISMFVAVPVMTWMILLLAGAVIHWLFNVVLFLVGAKKRAA